MLILDKLAPAMDVKVARLIACTTSDIQAKTSVATITNRSRNLRLV
jgi:hypothetical protein